MVAPWYQEVRKFKSPTYVVAAFLLRSRETQGSTNRRLQEEIAELKKRLEQQARREQQKRQEIDTLRQQVAGLQKELQVAKRSINLPDDPPLGTRDISWRLWSTHDRVGNEPRSAGWVSWCSPRPQIVF